MLFILLLMILLEARVLFGRDGMVEIGSEGVLI